MNHILNLTDIRPRDRRLVGGKAFSLAVLAQSGLKVPLTLVVTTRAYQDFTAATGLKGRILLELRRKNFADLRWEEIWDISLRIRHMFLTTPLPADLAATLRSGLAPQLPDRCVVRSSAPGEDSRQASFAGLHASFVNVVGLDAVLDHIKLVWASLWSDAALLYRRELGLNVQKSAMAVVVQEIVAGDKSGVVFGVSPQDDSQAVIEAVYGLNQGLVDGAVEPDRWLVDRETGAITGFQPAPRQSCLAPGEEGVRLAPLSPEQSRTPPLSEAEVDRVFQMVRKSEGLFGAPQDMEWTFAAEELIALQSRPITRRSKKTEGDQRPWYLSLRRSFDNLKALRRKVEDVLIPAMEEDAARLAAVPLESLSDARLREEISRRADLYRRWEKVYWDEFIPLAHGIRLFGMVYNDAVKPADAYEFLDLLGAADLLSLKRNRLLEAMAARVREQPDLLAELQTGRVRDEAFQTSLSTFTREFGDLACGALACPQGPESLVSLLREMASRPAKPERQAEGAITDRQAAFLSRFTGDKRAEMAEFLDLARASYRLRDDDNVHLGRIRAQFLKAVAASRHRSRPAVPGRGEPPGLSRKVLTLLKELEEGSHPQPAGPAPTGFGRPRARQLVGQPASPGLAQGPARIIGETSDLFGFQSGDVLVCDALDPGMTFVVPLAAGIVERRGGMLIHGSIIAREYGIPCVTGVPRATSRIPPGEKVTVDGYLGIVIVG